ncbi:hypothetical protein [Aeromicrobium sp. NPDC092404]|uniref:hypothetical protein n=1 Tax=Aeromicrobium sp. NPDC092404 TaxID=3154976 RepID=UPI00343EBBFD
MDTTTTTSTDQRGVSTIAEQPSPASRRISADLALGLALLGAVIVGRLLWAATDGSLLVAIGAR